MNNGNDWDEIVYKKSSICEKANHLIASFNILTISSLIFVISVKFFWIWIRPAELPGDILLNIAKRELKYSQKKSITTIEGINYKLVTDKNWYTNVIKTDENWNILNFTPDDVKIILKAFQSSLKK